jgi:hypothetical protein
MTAPITAGMKTNYCYQKFGGYKCRMGQKCFYYGGDNPVEY